MSTEQTQESWCSLCRRFAERHRGERITVDTTAADEWRAVLDRAPLRELTFDPELGMVVTVGVTAPGRQLRVARPTSIAWLDSTDGQSTLLIQDEIYGKFRVRCGATSRLH